MNTPTIPAGFLAASDINMDWRGQRFRGPRGSLFALAGEAERFAAEFRDRPNDLLLLDAATFAELVAERDAVIAERAAARAAEAEAARLAADQEAERVRRRDELVALVREAAIAT